MKLRVLRLTKGPNKTSKAALAQVILRTFRDKSKKFSIIVDPLNIVNLFSKVPK